MKGNIQNLIQEINENYPVTIDFYEYDGNTKKWNIEYIENQTEDEMRNDVEKYSCGFSAKTFKEIKAMFNELFPNAKEDIQLY